MSPCSHKNLHDNLQFSLFLANVLTNEFVILTILFLLCRRVIISIVLERQISFVVVCSFSYFSVFTWANVSVVFLQPVSMVGFISDHRVLYLIYKPVVYFDVLPYRDIYTYVYTICQEIFVLEYFREGLFRSICELKFSRITPI